MARGEAVSLNSKIYNWAVKPAYWWQFWQPQSGLVGGIIMFCVIMGITLLLTFLLT